MKQLSDKQTRMLAFIEEFIDEHGYPPTVRDIQYGCGLSSTSVVKYNLDRLSEGGYLTRDSEVSRGLAMPGGRGAAQSSREPETVAVPLMGTIAAGSPFPLPQSDIIRNLAIPLCPASPLPSNDRPVKRKRELLR